MSDNFFEAKLKQNELEAEKFAEAHRDHVDALEASALGKTRGITSWDVLCLKTQFENFQTYKRFLEEDGNVNQLGKIPSIAYDVITAVHGASIIPAVASVQPIEEERGTVYFKQIRASDSRGSATAGDLLVDPRTGVATPTGYSEAYSGGIVAVSPTTDAQVVYNFTLPVAAGQPIKSESVKIRLYNAINGGGSQTGEGLDVGVAEGGTPGIGRIFGDGLSGSVNYTTGAVSLTLAANPGAASSIVADFEVNYEKSQDIPQIESFFDSKGVRARIFALKGTLGLFQAYGMSKRFGMVAADEMAKDLVIEINREIGGRLVRDLRAASIGLTQFDKTAPSGVSFFEHKQTYKDSLANAEAVMTSNSGRGAISTLIVGINQAAIVRTLPGWEQISDGSALGTHIFGKLDGMVVVRVTDPSILGANEGIAMYKGLTPWEAPIVYAPYMPLTMTDLLPAAPNPLGSMRAAAVWAGIEPLVPQFATKHDVIAS